MNVNEGAPRAPRRPQERTFHGKTFVDNYEWMRTGEISEHIDAENAWFNEYTKDQGELRRQIVDEIAGHTRQTDVSVPTRKGNYWYWTRTWEGRPYEGLFRVAATGPNATERPDLAHMGVAESEVLDANQLGRFEEYFATGSGEVSPDGKLFALGIDTEGDELFHLRIHDIARELILDDAVVGAGYGLAWTADSKAVFYTRSDSAWRPYQLWLHRVGENPVSDTLLLEEHDENFGLWFEASRDGKWIVANLDSTDTTEAHLISTEDVSRRFVVSPRRHGLYYTVEVAGDELLILHNATNSGFTLASAPLAQSEPESWQPIFEASGTERLMEVQAFKTFAALSMRHDAGTQIRVFERASAGRVGAAGPDARRRGAAGAHAKHPGAAGPSDAAGTDSAAAGWLAPYPIPTAEGRSVEFGDNEVWDAAGLDVVVESITTPRTWQYWDVADRTLTTLKTLAVPGYDPADYVEYRVWAEAPDGVKVPVTVAHRADLARDGHRPGFVYGYGSYEISSDPRFTAMRLPLLERGLVYAIAHVRGGGELGRDWYEQGRLLNKKNSFSDFVAATRHLVNIGLLDPARIAAEGRSAGGLLMGAVANLAPELYRVILAGVPFVDALTTILKPELPLTVGEWEEWGNPIESEEVYDYMASYSPYENIRNVRYPAILATTSLNDVRVSYIEPTKWVQQLRHDVAADSGAILQYTEKVAGHFGGSGRFVMWEKRARELAFVLRELGVA